MAVTYRDAGVIGSYGSVANNQKPDIDKFLYLIEPIRTPFMSQLLYNKFSQVPVINENGKFSWFEDSFVKFNHLHRTEVTPPGNASTQTFTVVDSTAFKVGDYVLLETTNEMAYVSSIVASSTTVGEIGLTAVSGNFANTAHPVTAYIKILGNRVSEVRTTLTSSLSTKEYEISNYLTIFDETVQTSGRYQAGEKFTNGKTHKEQVQKMLKEMKLKANRMMLFSTENGAGATADRYTYGKGFFGFVLGNTNNVYSYTTGNFTEANFDVFLAKLFTKGSGRKIIYAGSNVFNTIAGVLKARFSPTQEVVKKYGIANGVSYMTAFGEAILTWDPSFDGKFSNCAFAIDPDYVKLRYMANDDKGSRKLRIEENVELPATDGKATRILMDLGLQVVGADDVHGLIYNSSLFPITAP